MGRAPRPPRLGRPPAGLSRGRRDGVGVPRSVGLLPRRVRTARRRRQRGRPGGSSGAGGRPRSLRRRRHLPSGLGGLRHRVGDVPRRAGRGGQRRRQRLSVPLGHHDQDDVQRGLQVQQRRPGARHGGSGRGHAALLHEGRGRAVPRGGRGQRRGQLRRRRRRRLPLHAARGLGDPRGDQGLRARLRLQGRPHALRGGVRRAVRGRPRRVHARVLGSRGVAPRTVRRRRQRLRRRHRRRLLRARGRTRHRRRRSLRLHDPRRPAGRGSAPGAGRGLRRRGGLRRGRHHLRPRRGRLRRGRRRGIGLLLHRPGLRGPRRARRPSRRDLRHQGQRLRRRHRRGLLSRRRTHRRQRLPRASARLPGRQRHRLGRRVRRGRRLRDRRRRLWGGRGRGGLLHQPRRAERRGP